jgi:hypothetical protein
MNKTTNNNQEELLSEAETNIPKDLPELERYLQPTFRTLNCHRGKIRRERTQVSIIINIESEKRHLRNSKSPKMSLNPIVNKEQ